MINTKDFQFISHKMYKRSIQNLKWYICIHMYAYIYSKSGVPCTNSQQATPIFQISERNKKSSKRWQLAPYTWAECTHLYQAPWLRLWQGLEAAWPLWLTGKTRAVYWEGHIWGCWKLLSWISLFVILEYKLAKVTYQVYSLITESTVALFQANGVVSLTSHAL